MVAAILTMADRLGLDTLAEGVETPEEQAMLAHLDAAGLSKYDMPEWFLPLEAFPLTASGKLRRH